MGADPTWWPPGMTKQWSPTLSPRQRATRHGEHVTNVEVRLRLGGMARGQDLRELRHDGGVRREPVDRVEFVRAQPPQRCMLQWLRFAAHEGGQPYAQCGP